MLSFGLVGPAVAMWGQSLLIAEDINTGEVKVEFSRLSDYGAGNTWISIDAKGKDSHRLNLVLDDITPGGTYICRFKVTNQGTIPVKVDTPTTVSNGFSIQCVLEETELDPGKSTMGRLIIEAGDVVAGTTTFELDLNFVQWNGKLLNRWAWWGDSLHLGGQLTIREPEVAEPAAIEMPVNHDDAFEALIKEEEPADDSVEGTDDTPEGEY